MAERMRGAARLRARSLRTLPLTVASFVATGAAASGLGMVFLGEAWWVAGMGVAALALTATSLLRRVPVPRVGALPWFAPSLGGLIVILIATTALHFGHLATAGLLPNTDTLTALRGGLGEASAELAVRSAPLEVPNGFAPVVTFGIAVLALLVELIAVTLRQPALAGLPLLGVLIVPPSITRWEVDAPVLVATGAAFLLLLWLDRLRRTGAGMLLPGVAVVAVAAIAGLLAPALGPHQSELELPGLPGRASPLLNLSADLRGAGSQTVLSYRSTGGPQYLAISHITDFEGDVWGPAERGDRQDGPPEFGPVAGLDDAVDRAEVRTDITIEALRGDLLPLPVRPTATEGLDDGWRLSPEGPNVSGAQLRGGETYSVTSLALNPDAEQGDAEAGDPADADRYLRVPRATPAIVGATAQQVVQGATTAAQQGAALESFFREGDFVYDEASPAPGVRDDQIEVLEDFLEVRRGFCVHFSSAMAVMARELGIPSRIAVGYLPGLPSLDGDGSFDVPANALHAWPELYLEGLGWTAFEPTPGREDVTAEPSATPSAVPSFTPEPSDAASPPPASTAPSPTPSSSAGAAPAPSEGVSLATGVISAVLLLVLALVLGPMLVRIGLRSSRLDSRGSGTESAWREVLATARDLGSVPDGEESPQGSAERLLGLMRPGDDRADQRASAAVAELLRRIERMRFAEHPGAESGEVSGDLGALVVRALRRAATPRDRLRATWAPASFAGLPRTAAARARRRGRAGRRGR